MLSNIIVYFRQNVKCGRETVLIFSEKVLDKPSFMCYNIKVVKNGLVAQLGERRVRNAEVEGSIPFGSIIIRNARPIGCAFSFAERKRGSFAACGRRLRALP